VVAVLPARNEAPTVGHVVLGLARLGIPALVVDDGSTDATGREASEAGAGVLRLEGGTGKGAAVRAGLKAARRLGYDAALLMDADGQHLPGDASRLLACRQRTGADIVVGSRMRTPDNMPWARWLTNGLMSLVLSLLSGLRLSDSQSGFRLVDLAATSALKLRADAFDIESELLIEAARMGLEVREVAIRTVYVTGRRSRIVWYRDLVRFLRLIGRQVLRKSTRS
jgi:glycosyltransferase involved in cell wall biosynthesis